MISDVKTPPSHFDIPTYIDHPESLYELNATIKSNILSVKNIELKWEKHVEKTLVVKGLHSCKTLSSPKPVPNKAFALCFGTRPKVAAPSWEIQWVFSGTPGIGNTGITGWGCFFPFSDFFCLSVRSPFFPIINFRCSAF